MDRATSKVALGVALGVVVALAAGEALLPRPASAVPRGAPVPAVATSALPPPSPNQVAEAHALGRTYAQVAAQLSPSVVKISVTKVRREREENPFKGTPFEKFFKEPPSRQHGLGSGVVIDRRGYILTNAHVVDDTEQVKVGFVDGKEVPGKVVGTDPRSDLAVIHVDGLEVQPARLGDSDRMLVGEVVMAIGNPFGLDHTVTVGVLSAKNRSGFDTGHYEDFLQTDASINPGNSGGPLINLDGEVVGITTMIAGIGTGIGFAVPSSMARPIVEQLIRTGKVVRPYLGILMQDLTPELRKSLGGGVPPKGALVAQVQPGSPAEKAGVRPGDVVLSIDGAATPGSKELQRAVLGKKVGAPVQLEVWRDGKTRRVSATTAELPAKEEAAPEKRGAGEGPKVGLGLQTVTPDVAHELGIPSHTRGAVVTSVDPNGPAAEAGVQEGDVILEVDHHAVASAADARRALSASRSEGHLLRLMRGQGALYLVVPPKS
jgi:serine protease Do